MLKKTDDGLGLARAARAEEARATRGAASISARARPPSRTGIATEKGPTV